MGGARAASPADTASDDVSRRLRRCFAGRARGPTGPAAAFLLWVGATVQAARALEEGLAVFGSLIGGGDPHRALGGFFFFFLFFFKAGLTVFGSLVWGGA